MDYNLKQIKNVVLGNLYYFDEINSTNEIALQTKDAPNGSLFFANKQLKGRGRMKREWISDSGEICMTVLLRPERDISKFSAITLVAGVAVSRVIEKSKIKWPNDIVLGGKKVCGILTESQISGNPVFAVGIGINVNNEQFPVDLINKGTSIYLETGIKQDKTNIIASILKEFWNLYDEFLLNGFSSIREEYNKKSATIGREIVIVKDNIKMCGRAIGIDDSGALIADINGKREILNSGEVSVRGLLGYN